MSLRPVQSAWGASITDHEVPDDDHRLDGHLRPRAPQQDAVHQVRQPAQVKRHDDAHKLEAQVQQGTALTVAETGRRKTPQ